MAMDIAVISSALIYVMFCCVLQGKGLDIDDDQNGSGSGYGCDYLTCDCTMVDYTAECPSTCDQSVCQSIESCLKNLNCGEDELSGEGSDDVVTTHIEGGISTASVVYLTAGTVAVCFFIALIIIIAVTLIKRRRTTNGENIYEGTAPSGDHEATVYQVIQRGPGEAGGGGGSCNPDDTAVYEVPVQKDDPVIQIKSLPLKGEASGDPYYSEPTTEIVYYENPEYEYQRQNKTSSDQSKSRRIGGQSSRDTSYATQGEDSNYDGIPDYDVPPKKIVSVKQPNPRSPKVQGSRNPYDVIQKEESAYDGIPDYDVPLQRKRSPPKNEIRGGQVSGDPYYEYMSTPHNLKRF